MDDEILITELVEQMEKDKSVFGKKKAMKYYYQLLVLLDTDPSFAMKRSALKKILSHQSNHLSVFMR